MLKRQLCFGKPDKTVRQPTEPCWFNFRGPGRKLRNAPPMALKTLPDCPAFYNAPNEIKGSNQTTNLGVRSSNLFGRATKALKLNTICRSSPFPESRSSPKEPRRNHPTGCHEATPSLAQRLRHVLSARSDQHLCRDAKALVQAADHCDRQPAFSA